MADYIIPFGVDSTDFFKGLNQMEDGLTNLEKSADHTNEAFKKSFDPAPAQHAADAAKKYTQELTNNEKKTQEILALAQQYAKVQSSLFSEKDLSKLSAYNTQLGKIEDELKQLGTTAKGALSLVGDAVKKAGDTIEGTAQKSTGLSKALGLLGKADTLLGIVGLGSVLSVVGDIVLEIGKNLIKTGDGFNEIAEKIKLLTNVSQEAHVEAGKQLTDLDFLYKATQNVALGTDERTRAAKALQAEFPDYFANIKTETILNGGAKSAYDELTKSILATANATAAKSKLDELAAQRLDILFQKEKIRNANANENASAVAVTVGGAGGSAATVSVAEVRKANDDRAAAAIKEQDILDKRLANQQAFLVKFAGGEKAITDVIIDANQKNIDKNDALIQKGIDGQIKGLNAQEKLAAEAQRQIDLLSDSKQREEIARVNDHYKQVAGAIKKGGLFTAAVEEEIEKDRLAAIDLINEKYAAATQRGIDKANRIREQALEKQKAQQKAFDDLLLKLTSQDQQLQAGAIPDDRASALATSDARFQKIKDDALQSVKDANVTEKQRVKLRVEANKLLEDADAASAQARIDINKKFDDAQAKLDEQQYRIRKAAEDALGALGDNRQDIELDRINQHYDDLTAAIKRGGLLTAEAQATIDKARDAAVEDSNIKFGTERIKKETDLNVATIKVSEEYANKSVATEKAKQLAILQAQLVGAENQIALLVVNGKDINSLEVKQAQQTIDNIKQQIKNTSGNNGKGQSLFEFLGIDPDGQRDILRYAAAASEAGKITADFLGNLAEAQQQQLDAQKAKVDQDNKDLDDLQNRLDKEKQLRDDGLANNVDVLQKELDAKMAQRDADLKNQQDIQAKQAALKKAQIIADSISQISNLITAASQIFEAFSSIPIVGVPLAIAAIGLMFGSFAVAKANAFKAVDQSFGKGGVVDGKSHAQGGRKYVSVDGRGGVVELEGGEHVTNKKSSQKYANILDAINRDEMTEETLRELLAGTGIALSGDKPREAVKVIRERNNYRQQIALSAAPVNDISGDVKDISKGVKYLAAKEKDRVERWQENGRQYVKKNGITTSEPIKK